MPTAIPEQINTTNKTVIDLLDRATLIRQMLLIADALSKKKKNACYALNGAWGVGKSFVINEFERQIVQYGQDGTTLDRFLLFHYDCWKYDYYAEPLTAIISVMLETIERDVHLLSDEAKQTITSTLKAIGFYALDHFDKRIENQVGISIKTVYDAIVNAQSDVLRKLDANHEFDSYYAIRATLDRLREVIAQLAEHQTLLLVVDELDRCLPEYTVKVLERLHHIFEGIPNVQIVLATDKTQLGHVVRQIFGNATSVEKYLEKFIQFEISIGEGMINSNFDHIFSSYTSQFSSTVTQYLDVNEFIRLLFSNIDIRTRIAIINRCELVHSLISPENLHNTNAHMCAEIFMVTIKHFKIMLPTDVYSNILSMDNPNHPNYQFTKLTGLYTLNSNWSNSLRSYYYSNGRHKECNISTIDGLILACLLEISGQTNISWVNSPIDIHCGEFSDYVKTFWQALSIIH